MLRLDPFVFPADTSLRFLLLIVFVLAWTVLLANGIGARFVDPEVEAALMACFEEFFGELDVERMDTQHLLEGGAFADCTAPFPLAAWFSIVILAVVVTIAVAGYYTNDRWIIRWSHLVPLPLDIMPALASTLADLCRQAGLARPVRFFWNPLGGHGPRAFGRPGRPCVALTGGLVAQLAREPERFAVVVLHELAHHRNGDVGKAFAAIAVWWAFVVAAVAPYLIAAALALVRTAEVDGAVLWNLRLAVIVAVVYLTRNALLRARELYADARVAGWMGPAAVLAAMPEASTEARRPRLWGVHALLAVHPSQGRRREAIEQPASLLRANVWDAFGTGLAAAAAIIPVLFAATLLFVLLAGLEDPGTGLALGFVPLAVIFAPSAVAAGAVALMVWRMHLAARLVAASRPPVARLALALALGYTLTLAFGFPFDLLLLTGGFGGARLASGFGRAATALAAGLLLGALYLVLYTFLAWVRAAADAWLLPMLHTRKPWRLAVAVVAIGALAAGSLLAILGFGHLILSVSLPFLATAEAAAPVLAFYGMGLAGAILFNPLMLLALVAAVLLPLAAARRERLGPPAVLPAWLGTGGSAAVPLPARPPLRPGLALALGVGAGALFFVVMPLAMRIGLLGFVQSLDDAAVVYLVYLAPAVAWQAAVAGAVAMAVPRHPILHGLLAGLVTGVLAALTLLAVPWLLGSPEVRLDAWFVLANVLYAGTFLAWAAAAVGAAISRRRGRRSSASASPG